MSAYHQFNSSSQKITFCICMHFFPQNLTFCPAVSSSDERMPQGPDEGLSPTWTPPSPLSPDPWPSEPSAPPSSHHEPAVSWTPEAAGGISHGHRPAHLALPAGWKPGEWVWAELETLTMECVCIEGKYSPKKIFAKHFSLFSTIWESSLCYFHRDWVWKVRSWFIIKD